MFEAGEEVICIDAGIKPEMLFAVIEMYPNWVKQDAVYTIRQFNDNDGIVTGVLLEEIRNPEIFIKLVNRTQEPMFSLSRFAKKAPIQSESISYTEKITEEFYAVN